MVAATLTARSVLYTLRLVLKLHRTDKSECSVAAPALALTVVISIMHAVILPGGTCRQVYVTEQHEPTPLRRSYRGRIQNACGSARWEQRRLTLLRPRLGRSICGGL